MFDLESVDYTVLTKYLITYGVVNNKILTDDMELLVLIANYYNIHDKTLAEEILKNIDRVYLEIKIEDLIRNKQKNKKIG